jgi:50S ribosomal subunit-associated GTPase HflX
LILSALNGDGREAVIARMLEHMGLDTQRVTLRIDVESEEGRTRLAQIYRHGRVIDQAGSGRRVVVVADLPRRFLETHGGGERKRAPGGRARPARRNEAT